jgi:hypothetical protein
MVDLEGRNHRYSLHIETIYHIEQKNPILLRVKFTNFAPLKSCRNMIYAFPKAPISVTLTVPGM